MTRNKETKDALVKENQICRNCKKNKIYSKKYLLCEECLKKYYPKSWVYCQKFRPSNQTRENKSKETGEKGTAGCCGLRQMSSPEEINKLIKETEKGCGTKEYEGHYKCRKNSLCPECETKLSTLKQCKEIIDGWKKFAGDKICEVVDEREKWEKREEELKEKLKRETKEYICYDKYIPIKPTDMWIFLETTIDKIFSGEKE